MMIQLHTGQGSIYVSAAHIVAVQRDDLNRHTLVTMTNGNTITVDEWPQDIVGRIPGGLLL
jgi:hypothetical protein